MMCESPLTTMLLLLLLLCYCYVSFLSVHAVKQAVLLNKKLRYVNGHQQCLVDDTKSNLEIAWQQLKEAKVALLEREVELEEAGRTSLEEITKMKCSKQELRVV